jgi:hypothetical protein
MAHSKTLLAGVMMLVALLAVACAGQPTPDQTAAPSQTTQAPADQAAPPADQNAAPAAAAPAEGAAPAQEQAPAQQPPQN